MSSFGQLDSVLESDHEAQAQYRRSSSSIVLEDEEGITPDELPTFTRRMCPDLSGKRGYGTNSSKTNHQNSRPLHRHSASSESGDDCDQPLTRRLSRTASTVISKLTRRRCTVAFEEVSKTSTKTPECSSEQRSKRPSMVEERRRSSLQKLKDLIVGKRKDSANSESFTIIGPDPDDNSNAKGLFERPVQSPRPDSMTANLTQLYNRKALPTAQIAPHLLDRTDYTADLEIQSMNTVEVCSNSSKPLGPLTSHPVDAGFVYETEADKEETVTPSPCIEDPITDWSHQNLKRKRFQQFSATAELVRPPLTTIQHSDRPQHSIKRKPLHPEPETAVNSDLSMFTELWDRRESHKTPVDLPASIDDIGILPPASMETASQSDIPTLTAPTANISIIAPHVPSSFSYSPSTEAIDQHPTPGQINPTIIPDLSSGSSFTLPSPFMPIPKVHSAQRSVVPLPHTTPDFSTPVAADWPSCTLSKFLEDDQLSTSATIADTASSREALPLQRYRNVLDEVREAAAAAILDRGNMMSVSGTVDMTALRGMEDMDGYDFAMRVLKWEHENREDDGEEYESRGRSRVRR